MFSVLYLPPRYLKGKLIGSGIHLNLNTEEKRCRVGGWREEIISILLLSKAKYVFLPKLVDGRHKIVVV